MTSSRRRRACAGPPRSSPSTWPGPSGPGSSTTWGIGEGGAAGPPNRYGDPAGHAWLAVAGPAEATRHVLTGLDDRGANMVSPSPIDRARSPR